jgi:hypothetical protein
LFKNCAALVIDDIGDVGNPCSCEDDGGGGGACIELLPAVPATIDEACPLLDIEAIIDVGCAILFID